MNETMPLDMLDWAAAVNASILLVYHADSYESAPYAIIGDMLLTRLASPDNGILGNAPEELRAPLLRWWNAPPPNAETLADMAPAMRQLYEGWQKVYEGWRRKELDRRKSS